MKKPSRLSMPAISPLGALTIISMMFSSFLLSQTRDYKLYILVLVIYIATYVLCLISVEQYYQAYNMKYKLYKTSKNTTRVVCKEARIDQEFLDEDVPEVIKNIRKEND